MLLMFFCFFRFVFLGVVDVVVVVVVVVGGVVVDDLSLIYR